MRSIQWDKSSNTYNGVLLVDEFDVDKIFPAITVSISNKAADATDAAWQQVITTLREEVTRLSERLATVEEQNRKCEEANHALHEEIIAMKKQLHLF